MDNFLNEFFGRKKKPEQSQPSGDTARPEISQPTGPAGPDLGKAEREKDPAREKEIEIKWDPRQRCLVVETKQGLELGLSKFMFELSEGEVHVVGTDEVQQPELTIIEKIYAGSKSEATGFYKKNGSGVGVKVDSESLSVRGKSSPGVVSGRYGNIQVGNVSGSGINIGGPGNIQVGNVSGSGITIGGRQTESSQLAPRRKMQVVLRVPVAKNVEGKKPNYQLEVKAGDVKVENTSGGVCNIVVNAGNVHIERYKGEKIELSNQSANVEIYESEGKFSIGAISGNIMIGNSTGSFRISAVSGNITLTNVTFTQDNKISATSGNIQAEVANKRLKVYAETLSGKITTSGSFVVTKDNRPQRGAGGNVDRSVTITGNVDGSVIITGIGGNVYFGTNVFSDGSAGGSIEGRFGEPGDQNNLLTLTTTSGNITIQQAPQIKQ